MQPTEPTIKIHKCECGREMYKWRHPHDPEQHDAVLKCIGCGKTKPIPAASTEPTKPEQRKCTCLPSVSGLYLMDTFCPIHGGGAKSSQPEASAKGERGLFEEPWTPDGLFITTAKGNRVSKDFPGELEKMIDRACQCVTACDGIPTSDLSSIPSKLQALRDAQANPPTDRTTIRHQREEIGKLHSVIDRLNFDYKAKLAEAERERDFLRREIGVVIKASESGTAPKSDYDRGRLEALQDVAKLLGSVLKSEGGVTP